MSRPTVTLTPAQKAEVETLAAVLNTEQIADYFGICRNTFSAIREREPDVDERYKRGKARAVGAIAQSLISKARAGNVACMIFYLKTQAGWREPERVEMSRPEGDPNRVVDARERLRELLDRYAPEKKEAEDGEAITVDAPRRLPAP